MKKVKAWALAAKNVWTQIKRNRAMRLFKRMMADKDSGLEQIVDKAVNKRAFAMVMNWLDNKGQMHCRFCPNTDQLHRHADYYLCDPHHRMVEAQPSTNGKKADPVLK